MVACKAHCFILSLLCISVVEASDNNRSTITETQAPVLQSIEKPIQTPAETPQPVDTEAHAALKELHTHLRASAVAKLVVAYVGSGMTKINLKDAFLMDVPSFGIVEMKHDEKQPVMIFRAHFLEQIKGKPSPQLRWGEFTYNYATDSLTAPTARSPYPNRSVRNSGGLRAILPEWTLEAVSKIHQRVHIKPISQGTLGRLMIHTEFLITKPDSPEYRLAQAAGINSPDAPLYQMNTETNTH
jgi:hypothetical protein